MAILKIARMGHPVLSRPAKAVADATAPEIRRLVADMVETMEDASGTGLAAPQVHVPLRVVVFFVDGERSRRENGEADQGAGDRGDGASGGVPLTVMINPVIEPLGPEKELGWEACLSVPELMGQVPRWRRIRYRFQDLDGRQHERTAEGFHARVVQHECDHLDGVLYPQRLADAKTLIFASEAHHIAAAQEAPVA